LEAYIYPSLKFTVLYHSVWIFGRYPNTPPVITKKVIFGLYIALQKSQITTAEKDSLWQRPDLTPTMLVGNCNLAHAMYPRVD